MRIIFENQHLCAVEKPGGVLTVPARTGAADPRPCLGRQLEQQLRVRLWPVHRLDLEVSGLVVFAKNADAHRVASSAFEQRRVHKRYEALTEGAERADPAVTTFKWESLLVRGKKRSFEAPHGKPAVTESQLLGRVPSARWLGPGVEGPPAELLHFSLEPHTGRAHQLRVHLARAGFPVVGDALYGALVPFAVPLTIALRSVRLELTDDGDRRALGLDAPLEIEGFTSPGLAR